MLDFWSVEFNRQKIYRKVEYNLYYEYFFCQDPEDTEEVILDDISYFLKKGFREIDLRLYNRVACFDFAETKNLLEKGANSTIDFYEDEDSNAMSGIATECTYLTTCHVIPEFKVFEKKGYDQKFDITEMFGNLLGLVAHENMYHLLNEYAEKE